MTLPNVFSWILENLAGLVPVRVVHEYERGVLFGPVKKGEQKWKVWQWRFRTGYAQRRDLKPGIKCYFPGFQSIEIIPIRPQTEHLWKASIMTKDGHSVSVRSNFGFSIWCAWRKFTMVDDFEKTLLAEAEVALTNTIRAHNFDDLRFNMEAVEQDMLDRIAPLARKWGALIHTFSITECVDCFHLRLIQ